MKNLYTQAEQGFTLIELMISITLGLLVIAIASQIYLTSYSTNAIQKSSGDITANSIFGIQQIESHVRLANMGNAITRINETTPGGGIVLSNKNVKGLNRKFFTSGGGFDDKLTIQFRNVTGKNIFDCEGHELANGDKVIERYYLYEGDLKCDASQNGISGLTSDEDGHTIIQGVDVFGIRIGAEDNVGIGYMSTDEYKKLEDKKDKSGNIVIEKPVITSIKMGFLLRGADPITGATRENFTLFGQKINKGSAKNMKGKYLRNVYESTVYLRNARFE